MVGRLGILLCVAFGCSSGAGHTAKPAPTIVVIEPGAEPRQRFRYEPEVGLDEEVELSTKVRVSNTFTNTTLETGQRFTDLPTIVIRGRLQVTGKSPEGDALVSFAVEHYQSLGDLIDPRLYQTLYERLRALDGAHSTWRLRPSGDHADVHVELPNAPQGMRDRESALSDLADSAFVRFPEADIGVGAIWQIETASEIAGVKWTRKATYVLRELTEGQAVVDVSMAMRAPSQNLRVEPNATTVLKSGEGTVTGQAVVPRRELITSSSSQTSTEASYLIARRHLRISSTLRTETLTTVKRIEPAEREVPVPVDASPDAAAPAGTP